MSSMASPDTETPAHPVAQQSTIAFPMTSGELSVLLGGELIGNPDIEVSTLGSIEDGVSGSLTFIRGKSFAKLWADSKCACALVTRGVDVEGHNPAERALIVVDDADLALVTILRAINPARSLPERGVHPSAVVDATAEIHQDASVGPGCCVGAGTKVGCGAVLVSNVTLGAEVVIGENTVLGSGVVIEDRCIVGSDCDFGANCVIGADGFGYLPPTESRAAIKVPQIGTVEIGDEVELGACVTIDRAKFGSTTVGDRTKIDNQVHIAHNCVVGTDALICGRTTLGGSCVVGDHAMIGGAVVLNDHATVGKSARVAGGAIVLETVPAGETYAGIPAIPARQALANYGSLRDLSSFVRTVEKRLKKLESQQSGS
ncbi:MAG: UDP-3-O-(3-hydroxymyristoyl)glucosamine N-acyltransferase [Phycisphaerales bacterium]